MARQNMLLQPVSVIDALINTLAQEIINGEWEPGEQLKDIEMAEKYDVSRNSIREAFSILVEKGLLKKRANRGVFVPKFSEDEVIELYNARLVIELEAIDSLTQKREVFPEMLQAVEDMKLTSEEKRSYYLDSDYQFHICMVKALSNSRLEAYMERLFTEIKIINRQPKMFFAIDYVIKEHNKIMDAIWAGDVRQSRDLMRDHVQQSISRQMAEMQNASKGGAQ